MLVKLTVKHTLIIYSMRNSSEKCIVQTVAVEPEVSSPALCFSGCGINLATVLALASPWKKSLSFGAEITS